MGGRVLDLDSLGLSPGDKEQGPCHGSAWAWWVPAWWDSQCLHGTAGEPGQGPGWGTLTALHRGPSV